jgi:FMNH2-dependent dimethyl sulfone monooxygenase
LCGALREVLQHRTRGIKLRGLSGDPKPYNGTRPLMMNAGSSPAGQDCALHHADFLFRGLRSIDEGAQDVTTARSTAAAIGREVGCFSAAHVLCRPANTRPVMSYYRISGPSRATRF